MARTGNGETQTCTCRYGKAVDASRAGTGKHANHAPHLGPVENDAVARPTTLSDLAHAGYKLVLAPGSPQTTHGAQSSEPSRGTRVSPVTTTGSETHHVARGESKVVACTSRVDQAPYTTIVRPKAPPYIGTATSPHA